MERTQFTFYESFLKAISRIKRKTDRCDAYDAICNYALYGTEPDLDSLPDSVAIAFELSKPNLDASRRKATSGQRGGKSKQKGSKPEASAKQVGSKKEKENEDEKEKENEEEDECPPKSPFSVVLAAYANKVNPMPGDMTIAELKGFFDTMGQDCCLRAIDIALDEKKATWSYIRGILRNKKEKGVRCLADWDALEEKREKGGLAGGARSSGISAGTAGTPEKRWNLQSADLGD